MSALLSVVVFALGLLAFGALSIGVTWLVVRWIARGKRLDKIQNSLDTRTNTAIEGLGAVSHTAPAEEGTHPGGVIRGISPCATTPPHRDASLPDEQPPVLTMAQKVDALRELAARASAQTHEPDWPYPAPGNWAFGIRWILGGATGEYCAAIHPDSLVVVLDSLQRLSGPCEQYTFGRCTHLLSIEDSCKPCVAVAALEALTTVREVQP